MGAAALIPLQNETSRPSPRLLSSSWAVPPNSVLSGNPNRCICVMYDRSVVLLPKWFTAGPHLAFECLSRRAYTHTVPPTADFPETKLSSFMYEQVARKCSIVWWVDYSLISLLWPLIATLFHSGSFGQSCLFIDESVTHLRVQASNKDVLSFLILCSYATHAKSPSARFTDNHDDITVAAFLLLYIYLKVCNELPMLCMVNALCHWVLWAFWVRCVQTFHPSDGRLNHQGQPHIVQPRYFHMNSVYFHQKWYACLKNVFLHLHGLQD